MFPDPVFFPIATMVALFRISTSKESQGVFHRPLCAVPAVDRPTFPTLQPGITDLLGIKPVARFDHVRALLAPLSVGNERRATLLPISSNRLGGNSLRVGIRHPTGFVPAQSCGCSFFSHLQVGSFGSGAFCSVASRLPIEFPNSAGRTEQRATTRTHTL